MDFRELLRNVLLASIPAFQVLWDTGVVLDWTETLTSSVLPTLSGQTPLLSLPAITEEFLSLERSAERRSPLDEPPLSRLLFPPAPQLVCPSHDHAHTAHVKKTFSATDPIQDYVGQAGIMAATEVTDHPLIAALAEVSSSFIPRSLRIPSSGLLYLLLFAISIPFVRRLWVSRSYKPPRRESDSGPLQPIAEDLYDTTFTFGILATRFEGRASQVVISSQEAQTHILSGLERRTVLLSTLSTRSMKSSTSQAPLHQEEQDAEFIPMDLVEEFDTPSLAPLALEDSFGATFGAIAATVVPQDLASTADNSTDLPAAATFDDPFDLCNNYPEQQRPPIRGYSDAPGTTDPTCENGSKVTSDASMDSTFSEDLAGGQDIELSDGIDGVATSTPVKPQNAPTNDPVPERSTTPAFQEEASIPMLASDAIESPNGGRRLQSPDYTPTASFPFMAPHEGLEQFLHEPMDIWDWTLVNVQLHEQGSFVRDYRPRAAPQTPQRDFGPHHPFIDRPNVYTHTSHPSFLHTVNSSDRRRTRSDNEHVYRRDVWLATRADVDPEPLLSPLSLSRFRSLSTRVGLLLPSRSLRPPRPLEELDLAVPEEKNLLKYYRQLCKTIKSRGKAPVQRWIPYGMRSRDFVEPPKQ